MLLCGILLKTLNHNDSSPFKTTHCFLLSIKSVIHNTKSVSVLWNVLHFVVCKVQ